MTSNPLLQETIYVSAAVTPFGPRDLTALLLAARSNNRRLGISGILVHQAGSFFQVLEGEPQRVAALFDHIERDPRHHKVLVLAQQNLTTRAFAEWSMGFVEAGQAGLADMPGFNDFFGQARSITQLPASAQHVKQLLLAFRGGRFRRYVDV
ncbi:MAG TPA: BLUF domain-containing protein [Polyangiaceae bacterium]|nr:BLUF domain-containing protein [Polyangiaceae bacterium]